MKKNKYRFSNNDFDKIDKSEHSSIRDINYKEESSTKEKKPIIVTIIDFCFSIIDFIINIICFIYNFAVGLLIFSLIFLPFPLAIGYLMINSPDYVLGEDDVAIVNMIENKDEEFCKTFNSEKSKVEIEIISEKFSAYSEKGTDFIKFKILTGEDVKEVKESFDNITVVNDLEDNAKPYLEKNFYHIKYNGNPTEEEKKIIQINKDGVLKLNIDKESLSKRIDTIVEDYRLTIHLPKNKSISQLIKS